MLVEVRHPKISICECRFFLKLKTNITTGRMMVDYPIMTYFRVIEGQLTDFGTLGKMLVVLERNKLASSGLRRSKENNFLYRII
jgi:hypothetical protein